VDAAVALASLGSVEAPHVSGRDGREITGRRNVGAEVKASVGSDIEALLSRQAGPGWWRARQRLLVVVEEKVRRRHRLAGLFLGAQPANLLQVAGVVEPPTQASPFVDNREIHANLSLEAEEGDLLDLIQRFVADDRVDPE